MSIASSDTIERRRSGAARRRVRGFTLIEALVSAALLTAGVAAVLGGFGALTQSEARARELETMQRLAFQKYDEILATSQDLSAPQEGDFKDQNIDAYTWKSEEEPSGVENLDAITVTVEKVNDKSDDAPRGVATGLVYVPPTTTATGGAQ